MLVYSLRHFLKKMTILIVKRIHWLRARAQKNRWHEELVVVTYEMQFTVRYFLHKCKYWYDGAQSIDITPGSRAYALRQHAKWNRLAFIADSIFKTTTSQYMSPL
jgi:hypothetical protein